MKDNLKDVGIWGQRHYQYLKENHPTTVNVMRMKGTLNSYLREVNEQADEMTFQLVKQLAKQEGVTEDLKRRFALRRRRHAGVYRRRYRGSVLSRDARTYQAVLRPADGHHDQKHRARV